MLSHGSAFPDVTLMDYPDYLVEMEIMAALIVTTFTSLGLLSIWAIYSRRHWFMRTAVVMAAVALPLAIPAYDLTWYFAAYCVVVVLATILMRTSQCLAINTWARHQQRIPWNDGISWRPSIGFSLLDALLALTLASIVFAVAASTPDETWMEASATYKMLNEGYQSTSDIIHICGVYGLIPAMIGMATISMTRCRNSVIAVAFIMIACFLWVEFYELPGSDMAGDSGRLRWHVIIQLHIGVLAVCPLLFQRATWWQPATMTIRGSSVSDASYSKPLRWVFGSIGVLLTALTCAPHLIAYFWILGASPFHRPPVPSPNGYAELLTVQERIVSVPDHESATKAELKSFVTKNRSNLDAIRYALQHDSRVPFMDVSEEALVIGVFTPDLDTISNALFAEGKYAETDLQFQHAMNCYLDATRLSRVRAKGGLIQDWAEAERMNETACYAIRDIRSKLTNPQRRQLVLNLLSLDNDRESLSNVISRDRKLAEESGGWQSRLFYGIMDVTGKNRKYPEYFLPARQHNEAAARLLITDLALSLYRDDRDSFPAKLSDLVPGYLSAVPIDPFSEEPMVYGRDGDKFLLYSIGENGIDDGGQDLRWPDEADDLQLDKAK